MPVIYIYLLIHFLIRMLFSQTIQMDDAEQIRLAQNLSLGYPIPQPPLYTWITWGLFQLFGTSLFILSLLKYLLIGLTFWLLWLSSIYLFQYQQSRWLSIFAFLLMPSFAWHMHQGFTHTILLGLSIAMTLHAILRMQQHDSNNNYLYLGLALAAGIMAKYSFLLFMIPILLAAFSIQKYRQRLIKYQTLITVAVVATITSPHLLWLAQNYQDVFIAIDQKLLITQNNLFMQKITSLWKFIISAIAFVTPLIVILAIFSGRKLFTSPLKNHNISIQLLSRFYIIIITATLLFSLFFTMPHFKVRWFHPIMMLFPLWLLAHIETSRPPSKKLLHWMGAITLLISVLIIMIRIGQLTIGPELGHYSRLNRPIIESLKKLPSFKQSTMLVTDDDFLGAHLLSKYATNPIIINKTYFRTRPFSTPTECMLLWDNDDPTTPPDLVDSINTGNIKTDIGILTYTLHYAILPKASCP